MLNKMIAKNYDLALFILRITIGIVFFTHGSQKVLGFFGGQGMVGTEEMFAKLGIPFPNLTAWVVGLSELVGGIALFIGFFTREFALLICAVMIGAIMTVTGKNGFFIMQQGYEYNVTILAACLCLFFAGGGGGSFDSLLFPKRRWEFIRDSSQIKLEPPED